jgi:hypothetical protein
MNTRDRRIVLGLSCALFGLVFSGCGGKLDTAFPGDAQWILESPDTFELMTVDPSHETPPANAKLIGGFYRILGQASITDAGLRKQLVDSLYDAALNNNGEMAKCFNPRHAIRAVRGGKMTEIVICFECSSLQTTTGGVRSSAAINAAKESYFNEAATKAGLPLASRTN